MISRLKGEVVDKSEGRLTIDVNGVGYEVLVSTIDSEELLLNETAVIYTHFHVRENSQELYGFSDGGRKQLFERLITINGIGPRMALAIMGLGEESRLKSAIAAGNIPYLTAAPGVGKKAAERIVLELKEKVGPLGEFATVSQNADDALDALVALGFSRGQAAQALAEIDTSLPTDQRVKQALKVLA